MAAKILLNLLAVLILGIIQVSFLTTWPPPINALNLILSLVIFLGVIVDYRRSLVLAFAGGLFLDLFSFNTFGLVTLAMILVAITVNFLFNEIFTNRSLYSLLILGSTGILIYNILITVGNFFAHFFGFGLAVSLDWIYFSGLAWQLFLNVLILTIIFFIFHFSTGRLKANFLLSR